MSIIKITSAEFIGTLNRLPTTKLKDWIKEYITDIDDLQYKSWNTSLLSILIRQCPDGLKVFEPNSKVFDHETGINGDEFEQILQDICNPGHCFSVPANYGTGYFTSSHPNVFPAHVDFCVSETGIISMLLPYGVSEGPLYCIPVGKNGQVKLNEYYIPSFLYTEPQYRYKPGNMLIPEKLPKGMVGVRYNSREYKEYKKLIEKRKKLNIIDNKW